MITDETKIKRKKRRENTAAWQIARCTRSSWNCRKYKGEGKPYTKKELKKKTKNWFAGKCADYADYLVNIDIPPKPEKIKEEKPKKVVKEKKVKKDKKVKKNTVETSKKAALNEKKKAGAMFMTTAGAAMLGAALF